MNSTDIIPFHFDEVSVRTLLIEGKPWFVANDITNALGYKNGRDAVAKHTSDPQRRVSRIATPSGEQAMTVISEGGVWRLVMRSNNPDAIDFQDWLADTVIPSLMRTGSYNAPADDLALPQTYLEALEALVQRERTNLALEQENAQLTPRATAWDAIASAEGDYSVGEAAKMLARAGVQGMGPTRLFQRLAEIRWTYRAADRSWAPYADRVEKGYLALKPQFHYHPGTGEKVIDSPQLRVTVKGIERLRQRLGGTQPALRAVNA
jgi:prophage antirepressor-like protein